ncbi:DUF4893 domain-containing protein [Paracoccus sp. S-4012]|uniref:DUF4893 domain-containing protein n=1 Tax=Paracoccus sp. S-4012 TaxID=2665648 RepID=UPI0012AFA528|nr:DUF4893 domain-containing protein [Paracoccus sp. S-4012]MRX51584.1 DUF4893 domain-containing protein [Paracoccus sp. S-4012]
MRLIFAAMALLVAGGTTAATLPDGATMRGEDAERLAALPEAYGNALREALAGASADDIEGLVAALSGAPQPVPPEALAGDWRCRTIKVGGLTPMTAYDPFRCRVTAEGGRVLFEKLTGSQRVRGEVHEAEEGLVLLGVGYIAGDTPPDYAALPEEIDAGASPQITADPGVIEMTGPDSGRILFPYPMLESVMDVLVLSR